LRRAALPLAAAALLAGCGPQQESASTEPADAAVAGETPSDPADQPALASRECVDVVQFYLEAVGGGEWALAARVWQDPAVDAARLEAVYAGYREPQVEWQEPVVEGAAGSLYCTVSGTLTDAQDPAKSPVDGTLLLRRANDVPGATADELRWTLRVSTFVERLERSDGSEP
jgi:hypothetical protein